MHVHILKWNCERLHTLEPEQVNNRHEFWRVTKPSFLNADGKEEF